MRRLATLQLAGPVALLLAAAAADSAAWALSQSPSSALLWYLNLEVFSLFRRSRWIMSDLGSLPFAQLLLIAGPLAFLAFLGTILRRNLLVAIASNLSLVYATFVLFSWHAWTSQARVSIASLSAVQVPTGESFYLFVVLLVASAASFSASHVLYIRALRKRA
jgi:hypothetical protein